MVQCPVAPNPSLGGVCPVPRNPSLGHHLPCMLGQEGSHSAPPAMVPPSVGQLRASPQLSSPCPPSQGGLSALINLSAVN